MNDLTISIQALLDVASSEAKIKTQINQLKLDAVKIGVEVDTASIKKAVAEINNLIQQATTQQGRQWQGLLQTPTIDSSSSRALTQMRQYYADLQRESSKAANQMQARASQYWQGRFGESISGMTSTNGTLVEMREYYSALESSSNSTGNALDGIASKAITAAVKLKAMSLAAQGIREMVDEVVALDHSLTELNKVANLSAGELNGFAAKAYEAAEHIGRTGRELVDAVTAFKKSGYDLETSLQLGQSALVMTNIGDGIANATDAASAMIAVLRGFNFDDSQATRILDAINQVSNTSPIAFENITEGLTRTAGVLSQTNTSLEQTIGLLTGGFSQLRNIEKVSTGLVTISQRLRGVEGVPSSVEFGRRQRREGLIYLSCNNKKSDDQEGAVTHERIPEGTGIGQGEYRGIGHGNAHGTGERRAVGPVSTGWA